MKTVILQIMLVIPIHFCLYHESRSFRKSVLSYQKLVFLVWKQSNDCKDDKCHLILSFPEEDAAIQLEESIKCSKVIEIIKKTIDYKLKFATMSRFLVKKLTEDLMHFQE